MHKLPVAGKAHEAAAQDSFVWFVYGSSLDGEAFAKWSAEHGYRAPELARGKPAVLRDYRLAFDVASRFWGGAVASLTAAPGRSVEGLALPMPGEARGLVDHKEGAISGLYEAFPVTLEVGGDPVAALAYRSVPSRRLAEEATPSAGFVRTLIAGAAALGLGEAYQAELRALLPK